jgi:folylpolyglutamate synthase/dihydropteroate synthase
VRALHDYLASTPAPAGRDLLYGSLEGKRADRSLRELAPSFERVTLTEPRSPKALPVAALAEVASEAAAIPEPHLALEHALAAAADRELVVCGSLYLVGEVRALLRARFGTPRAAAEVVTG